MPTFKDYVKESRIVNISGIDKNGKRVTYGFEFKEAPGRLMYKGKRYSISNSDNTISLSGLSASKRSVLLKDVEIPKADKDIKDYFI
jgi:hypothetical protein